MPFSDNIFKAYDVRGVYPTELNEEAALAIGEAVAKLVPGGKVVVARDMRTSSLSLHQHLIGGLLQGGVAVDDLELMPIDAVYFAVGKFGYDAGVMVTASHNPPQYNGFKIVKKGVEVVRGTEVKKLIEPIRKRSSPAITASERDIWPDYITHLRSFVDIPVLKPLRVVVDAGNGLAGIVIPQLFDGLPFELTPLSFELDGTFPNRPSNPLAPGAHEAAAELVKKVGADVGIMFDGDTDRVFFLTEQGVFVPADVTLLLLAREFLRREPGAAIVYNLICSRAVPEFIKQWGGRPVRTAVGYVNIRQAVIQEKAILGGELSAHYSFRDSFSSDSGF
ncbi:MAG: phosphomannomutase/phosphoglucomutase, partial [Candidatus Veblenbacteria bacterium]|nr:phosphomannomutase/phosphoglucomutase [Candidatus Veblenbacteria bacterium]